MIFETKGRPTGMQWHILFLALPIGIALWAVPHFLPWGDEAQFADPGANLYFGAGFTSSTWPYQAPQEMFAGNAPGYSALLALWFKVVGFGVFQARALNLLLGLVAVYFLASGLRRSVPSMAPWLQAASIAACFMGYGSTISCWSVRYDALGILFASALFYAWVGPNTRQTKVFIAVLGLCLFLSGFHLVVAAIAVSGILLFTFGRKVLPKVIALLSGLGAGWILWLAILATQGLVKKFFLITFGSQHTISGQLGKLVLEGDRAILDRGRNVVETLVQDPSLIVMIVALALLWFIKRRTSPVAEFEGLYERRVLGRLAIGLVLVVPLALSVAGKFPIYYTWMAFFPAVILSAVVVHKMPEKRRYISLALFVVGISVASLVGVGKFAADVVVQEHSGYRTFENWLTRNLAPQDVAYCDFEAYFAARSVAQRVFTSTYGNTRIVPGIPERDTISVLAVQVRHFDEVARQVGGVWVPVEKYADRLQPKLNYLVARRAP